MAAKPSSNVLLPVWAGLVLATPLGSSWLHSHIMGGQAWEAGAVPAALARAAASLEGVADAMGAEVSASMSRWSKGVTAGKVGLLAAKICPGDREATRAAYDKTEEKTAGVGLKMDLAFSLLRLDMAAGEWHAVKAGIEKAARLCDEGGDWERKNRLKVYQALFSLATRNFKRASELFLDSCATFGATELMSYEESIFYAVVASIISLDRVDLKKRVVDAPEILAVIDSIPHLTQYLNALYNCQYADCFRAFVEVIDRISTDRYLQPHVRHYIREVRVVAYSQFLESYKSVTLESMAASFGVSIDWLDAELADFIVAGRLTAKIDKVAGIIETNRLDAKNAQYQQTIKQGDVLLNRIQKLSKVVDLE